MDVKNIKFINYYFFLNKKMDVVKIVRSTGREPATVKETKEIISIK